jgi:hypothetical protein
MRPAHLKIPWTEKPNLCSEPNKSRCQAGFLSPLHLRDPTGNKKASRHAERFQKS